MEAIVYEGIDAQNFRFTGNVQGINCPLAVGSYFLHMGRDYLSFDVVLSVFYC